MENKKKSINKKNLILLDFDGTLYRNQLRNYTLDINLNNILPAHSFFSELQYQIGLFTPYDFAHKTHFILASGRPTRQKKVILLYLHKNGYTINEAYFSNYSQITNPQLTSIFDENNFLLKYWAAKVQLINRLHNSGKYKS